MPKTVTTFEDFADSVNSRVLLEVQKKMPGMFKDELQGFLECLFDRGWEMNIPDEDLVKVKRHA